ncbi:hypothetical protein K525DRAFT_187404 [Schizophyllum commune Loenen D]|nr:hypothetical protein K525DRAFT_187404 [Schizophyllum commune Loenen D]
MPPRPSECKSGYASSRRRNLTLPNRRQSTTFFEYRCPGPPDDEIGTLGDIYVDTDPRTCEIYAKLEGGWTMWPGLHIRATGRLAHPSFSELLLTISAKNRTVGWFDETHAPPRMYAGCRTSHECTLRFLQEKEERAPAKRRRSGGQDDLTAKRAKSSFVHTFHPSAHQGLPSYPPIYPPTHTFDSVYYAQRHNSHSFDGSGEKAALYRQPLGQLYPYQEPLAVHAELGPLECDRHATCGPASTGSFGSFSCYGRDDEDKSHASADVTTLDTFPSPFSSNKRLRIAQPQAVVIRDLMATHQLLNAFGASTAPSPASNGSPRSDDLAYDIPELSSSTSASSAASEDLPLPSARLATQLAKTSPLAKTSSHDTAVPPEDPTPSSPRAYTHLSTRSTTGTSSSGLEARVSFVEPESATQTRAFPVDSEPTTSRKGDLRAVLEDALTWIDCLPEVARESEVATCRLQDTVLSSSSMQETSSGCSLTSPATDCPSPCSVADSPQLAYKTPQQILDEYAAQQTPSPPVLSFDLASTSGASGVPVPPVASSASPAIECFDLRDQRLSPAHALRARLDQNPFASCRLAPLASGSRPPASDPSVVLSPTPMRSCIAAPQKALQSTAAPPAYWNYDYRRPLHPAYYFPRASVAPQGKTGARFLPGYPVAQRDRSGQPPYRRRTMPTVQTVPSSSSCLSSSVYANDVHVADTSLAHGLPAPAPYVRGPPSTSSAIRAYTAAHTEYSLSYPLPADVGGSSG